MQRNQDESRQHLDLIRMMASYFANSGFGNIRADIPGLPPPDIIYGIRRNHIPDLTADKINIRIILEAETSDSIFDEHTVSQWSLFSNAAKSNGGEFHVVVPKGYRHTAERRSAELFIQIDTIWTPK